MIFIIIFLVGWVFLLLRKVDKLNDLLDKEKYENLELINYIMEKEEEK